MTRLPWVRGQAADPGWVPLRRHRPGPRRLLAAGVAAAGVAAGLQILAPDPPRGTFVVIAVREVPAGAALTSDDVALARRPPDDVPTGAVRDVDAVLGRVVTAGLEPGEMITAQRTLGPGLLAGRPSGEVAAPVRIADPEAAALLRPGDRVDVLVAVEGAATARRVTLGATVLARPATTRSSGLGAATGGLAATEAAGGLVLLAVRASEAGDLAQAAAQGPLSVLVR